jgi:preprotein translocase subunit SecD
VASKNVGSTARPLIALLLATVSICAWAFWPSDQANTPKLGLDLRGGTQVRLTPKTVSGGEITDSQLGQAVNIIRQRVNGLGVAEAEVSTEGSGNSAAILVSIPGVSQQNIADVLKQTALLSFRPVEAEVASQAPTAASEGLIAPISSDTNDKALQTAFVNIDCTNPATRQGGEIEDATKWIVTCSRDGSVKYLLQPAFIKGETITDARAEIPQNSAAWQVSLDFNDEGSAQLADASNLLYKKTSPQNQFAIVIDGLVFSSPYFSEPILGGSASITGQFTQEEAQDLSSVLRYGSLPLTLELAEVTSLSPTLGQGQLDAGILAGALGLFLVMIYLIVYYRALGLVAVFSLVVAAVITYASVVALGKQIGFTLTLAGIAGAIVAVGITADSFIVYFERIRDEIREGKSLKTAVNAGWVRARRTILVADFVSLLAAVVLYILSIGSVRGFAFTLGLTTLIDVFVALLFSRPMVVIFTRNKWFANGSPMTGLSATRLGQVAPKANSESAGI